MGVGPNNEKVAAKFEKEGTRCPQLRHEYKVYRELVNCHGFCSVYYFGQQDNHNVMVMDLMGLSLEDLFNKCARKFSLKTVLQIADQMLERADTLHARHLIHRDIKPANFVIGLADQAANVFCVDFGLSKRYRHPKTLQHIPHRDGRSLTGTPRYASINNHLGIEQSRRDDLESIAYILIYFLKGTLPWQGLKAKNASKKYMLILNKKQSVSIAQLCQGCPSQFAEFLAYSRSLKFDAKPDIPYLRKIFRDLYNSQGCANSSKMWDWDGLDLDAGSVAGSAGGGQVVGPPAILGQPPALRPSTSAAVAPANEHGGFSGLLGGLFNNSRTGSGRDLDAGLEDDDGFKRPQTTAVMGRAQPSSSQQAQWGFARPSQGGLLPPAGILKSQEPASHMAVGGSAADYQTGLGMGNLAHGQGQGQGQAQAHSNRRPHTAHALRAPDGAPDDDPHVVAGARAMMRYSNSTNRPRNSLDAPVGGAGVGVGVGMSSSGGGGGGGVACSAPVSAKGWSMGGAGAGIAGGGVVGGGAGSKYPALGASGGQGSSQQGGYTTSASNYNAMLTQAQVQPQGQGQGQVQVQGRGSVAKPVGAGATGWVQQDQRPRSAASGLGVLPHAVPPGGTGAGVGAGAGAGVGVGGGATLSYGSLKNRFLSGSPQGQGQGQGQGQYAGSGGSASGGQTGAQGGAKTTASRIFGGLAR